MTDVPQEIKEVLNNKDLQETVQRQPVSLRFKAMALGLAALQYIKGHEKDEPSSEPETENNR